MHPPPPYSADAFLSLLRSICRIPVHQPGSAEFQRCQTKQGANPRDDPETGDDLSLGPSLLFEVMVDGGTEENPFAGKFETGNLKHDGKTFHDKDEPDHKEQELLCGKDRNETDAAAERQIGRAHV